MDARRRRRIAARVAGVVVAAGIVLAGCYLLLGIGEHDATGEGNAATQGDKTAAAGSGVASTTVARVKDTRDLDPELTVIVVPLGTQTVIPEVSGKLIGAQGGTPVQLGPRGKPGMTLDPFGSRATMLTTDGQKLVYHFWRHLREFPTEAPGDPVVAEGTPLFTPTIRALDLATGEDSVLVSGARSFALRADGMFAYAEGVEPDYRYDMPYLQRVVVRKGLDGPPQVWTTKEDRYTVLQWARGSLFVHREPVGGEPELLVLDGPGKVRPVLPHGEQFICTSSDGSRILTWTGGAGTPDPLVLHLVEWQGGKHVSSLTLDGLHDPSTGELDPGIAITDGSWEGDRVVVSLNVGGLALLSAKGDELALEKVVTFSYPQADLSSVADVELSGSGNQVFAVTWEGPDVDTQDHTAVLTYDLAGGECSRWISPGARALVCLVSNPSRPR